MRIYIVRHGETEANKYGMLQGSMNYNLNDSGIRLAKVTGSKLYSVSFDEAFTSPLLRAKETCDIILKESGNIDTKINIEPRIREIEMGDWEGKIYSPTKKEISGDVIEAFFKGNLEKSYCPNGESLATLCERTQDFLKELVERNDDKTYLVSTHGCALRAMLNFLYENKSDFWQGHVPYNLCVNILEAKDGNIKFIEKDKIYYDKSECIDRYATK